MSDAPAPARETPADFGPAPEGPADRWKAEIRAWHRERERWCERVETISKLYRDERDMHDDGERQFALLWANIEVLKPTLYAKDPKPEVARRFKDKDPVGRVAAVILERNLDVAIDADGSFGRTMGSVVTDLLLGGQGQAWVRYDPVMGVGPDGVPLATSERVAVDYVHWRDFGCTAGARTWDEVTCVFRRSFLTRDALVERFGERIGRRIPLDRKREGDDADPAKAVFGKATIYELWDRTDRKVRWVHLDEAELLDERPYPLKLLSPFPCPAPLFGTLTNDSLTPVPDYRYYQDQANELNILTARISALAESLRVVGLTPGDKAGDVQRALDMGGDGKILPVESWAAFGGQQAMDKLIVWLPIEEIARTLMQLVELREKVKADAYEITGLSDIIRGSTVASETATAQQIKSQWGSVRVRTRQQDVQRFAAELLNLMAQVMCGHFDAERLAATANVDGLPVEEQQHVPAALDLLKGDGALLHYRVDVETDSTIEADQQAQKAAWTEMLTGISGFMAAMLPVMQGVAQAAPSAAVAWSGMVGVLLTGAVRQLQPGPAVEASIEAAFEALGQAASQPPAQAAPDPRIEIDRMKAETERDRLKLDAQRAQDETAHKDADRQQRQNEIQVKAQEADLDTQHQDADRQFEAKKLQVEAMLRLREQEQQDAHATRQQDHAETQAERDAAIREREAAAAKREKRGG